MKKGSVFDIQRFSISDGPGVRTSVFFKGCNLRCVWCHNPESQALKTEIQYKESLCIGCGKCIRICENGAHQLNELLRHIYKRNLCKECGECTRSCNAKALELVGKDMCVEAILNEVVKDCALYKLSGGGITLTGGEPLLQPEFAASLLKAAQAEGIHTAVETAGFVRWDSLEAVATHTNLFLYDVKGFDSKRHAKNAGSGNERVLANLKKLALIAEIFIRMPLIAGLNDSLEEAAMGTEFLKSLEGVRQIELLPYHRFGEAKYPLVGRTASCFEAPSLERMQAIAKIFEKTGKKVIVHTA